MIFSTSASCDPHLGSVLRRRRELQVRLELLRRPRVVLLHRQKHAENVTHFGNRVPRIQPLGRQRALLRRLKILQIVVGHRVEEERLRIVERIQLHQLVRHVRQPLPLLRLQFQNRNLTGTA